MIHGLSSLRRSGRPLGTAQSAAPKFTLARLGAGLGTVAIARWLTDQGLATNQSSIARWETGETRPSEERMELLAVLFAVSPETVVGWFFPGEVVCEPADLRVELAQGTRRAS